jgi:hypothetical protein
MDRKNERLRVKRQTDPEWVKKYRAESRRRSSNRREENRSRIAEYKRDIWDKRYAQDPVLRLRKFVHNAVTHHAWFREGLP